MILREKEYSAVVLLKEVAQPTVRVQFILTNFGLEEDI
jgi:hypothetical protein